MSSILDLIGQDVNKVFGIGTSKPAASTTPTGQAANDLSLQDRVQQINDIMTKKKKAVTPDPTETQNNSSAANALLGNNPVLNSIVGLR